MKRCVTASSAHVLSMLPACSSGSVSPVCLLLMLLRRFGLFGQVFVSLQVCSPRAVFSYCCVPVSCCVRTARPVGAFSPVVSPFGSSQLAALFAPVPAGWCSLFCRLHPDVQRPVQLSSAVARTLVRYHFSSAHPTPPNSISTNSKSCTIRTRMRVSFVSFGPKISLIKSKNLTIYLQFE